MDLAELIVSKRHEIKAVAAKHGASHVRVFGSLARGDYDDSSDVDFLVDLEKDRGLFDLCGLIEDLKDLLGVKVDVGTDRMLKDRNRDQILKEAREL